jgi:hypothetical protein
MLSEIGYDEGTGYEDSWDRQDKIHQQAYFCCSLVYREINVGGYENNKKKRKLD